MSNQRNMIESTYRRSDVSARPSVVVSELLLEQEDGPITDLAPLSESIDPEALDAIFDDRNDGTARSGGVVSFDHDGHRIVVEREESYLVTIEAKE